MSGEFLSILLPLIASFFLGAIPTSYLLVMRRTGQDIRTLGSGNPGATNVFRSVGKKEGALTLAFDALKGALAIVIFSRLLASPIEDVQLYRFLLGASAILGHVFSPFLGFKGGKGVAVGAGMAFAAFPINFGIAFVVWLVLLIVTEYMSVASIASAYVFAAASFWTFSNRSLSFALLGAAVFITWTHRSNLSRLFKGQENRTKLFNRHKI